MRTVTSSAGRLARMCAGWLGLYIAAGGALGFVVRPGPYTTEPGCYPHYTVFGGIETNCPVEFVNILWLVAVSVPRVPIIITGLAFALIKAGLDVDPRHLLNALPFVVASLPLLILYYVSFRYWRQRGSRIAILIPILIGMEAVGAGLMM